MSAGGRKAAAVLKEERLHCVLPRWLGGGLIALGVLVVLVVVSSVGHRVCPKTIFFLGDLLEISRDLPRIAGDL
jgi:hypothetical protein